MVSSTTCKYIQNLQQNRTGRVRILQYKIVSIFSYRVHILFNMYVCVSIHSLTIIHYKISVTHHHGSLYKILYMTIYMILLIRSILLIDLYDNIYDFTSPKHSSNIFVYKVCIQPHGKHFLIHP